MTNPHAIALGRLGGLKGGKSKSEAKVKAAQENGKKGGRPPGKRKIEIYTIKFTIRCDGMIETATGQTRCQQWHQVSDGSLAKAKREFKNAGWKTGKKCLCPNCNKGKKSL